MKGLRLLPALMMAIAVTACESSLDTSAGPETSIRPPAAPVAVAAMTVGQSEESRALSLFYARLEQRLVAQGLLRQDGGAGTAFSAADLARNFERIALFSEYTQMGGRYVAQQSRAQLRRWEKPVRIELHFGPSVLDAVKEADRRRIEAYVRRLRRAAGHPIDVVASNGNFHVFVASIDEQRKLGPQIMAAEPGLSRQTVRDITSLNRNTYCAVYASSSSDQPNAYVSAIALVRSEHPNLFRQSCYQEEIVQGLGLANDSPQVRPSIFNDDEEFALLTRHDELLLKILYDRRLRVGMTAEEARPIVQRIAAQLVGSGPV